MADEKNGVSKSGSQSEMSPQEDGTKVPLTAESPVDTVEVKFTSKTSPNGDAKIDVGTVPTFSGLSKEELMKYSNDPFWVKLRWFLFLLFWFAWLVMLVVAIVVIVLTPRCEPPPALMWVQESPMLEYSSIDYDQEFTEAMESMNIKTAYVPNVINTKDFEKFVEGRESLLSDLSKKMGEKNLKIATDFVDDDLPTNHVWRQNDTSDLLMEDSQTLNYSSPALIDKLSEVLDFWGEKGFTGFLMESTNEDKEAARDLFNEKLAEKGIAVGSNIVNVNLDLSSFPEENYFNDYLMKNAEQNSSWKYYKYSPFDAVGEGQFSDNHVPLVTMGLFLIPGTPMLKLDTKHPSANTTIEVIQHISKLRSEDVIKFGNTTFSNVTDIPNVASYARIQKGVPGYAVAVNLGTQEQTVGFSGVKNIPDTGKLKYRFFNGTMVSGNNFEEEMNMVTLRQLE